MDVIWIDSTEALSAWIGGLDGRPLAVDTEADSFHHYREKACLIQLSSGGRHALVDPLAGVDLSPLARPFSRSDVTKILHGSDYDIRLLSRDFGLAITGLSDTMISARLLGEPAVGLAALLAAHLGVTLDKSHQRADWSRRPLPERMRAYAVEDTRHLETLAAMLDARLAASGRAAWAREECERLEQARWSERRRDDAQAFRRTRGSKGLDRRRLAVLRELWSWRDKTARRLDRPAFHVLREEALLALASTAPTTAEELGKVRGLPPALLRPPSALEIVDAATRGLACPESDLPELRVDERPVIEPSVAARIARIRERRDRIAKELALDPSILASRATIEDMAQRWEAGDDPWSVPDLRRWQIALLQPAIT